MNVKNVAQKLMKNLCAPTSVLHVANLSEECDREMLKAYLEQAIRYETGVAEKDALVAYVTRSISNSGTILLCRRLNVEHACCRNLKYLESRAATRVSAR